MTLVLVKSRFYIFLINTPVVPLSTTIYPSCSGRDSEQCVKFPVLSILSLSAIKVKILLCNSYEIMSILKQIKKKPE